MLAFKVIAKFRPRGPFFLKLIFFHEIQTGKKLLPICSRRWKKLLQRSGKNELQTILFNHLKTFLFWLQLWKRKHLYPKKNNMLLLFFLIALPKGCPFKLIQPLFMG